MAVVVATICMIGPFAAPARGAEPADTTATPARVAPADATNDVDAALASAQELLRDGDYDRAIEVLKPALQAARLAAMPPDSTGFGVDPTAEVEPGAWLRVRDVYLLMTKTYVFIGNDLKFKPQGREASNLNYQEARRLIGECLGIHALRRTQADPASDPPEMVQFFDEVRREMFGGFRVVAVEPAEAFVLLDGDTLETLPDEDAYAGDMYLAVGPHEVLVRARESGYHEYVDEISISPDVTLERSYYLPKRRSWLWYTLWGTGIGAAGGLIASLAGNGGSGGPAALTPLPDAPGPPSGP